MLYILITYATIDNIVYERHKKIISLGLWKLEIHLCTRTSDSEVDWIVIIITTIIIVLDRIHVNVDKTCLITTAFKLPTREIRKRIAEVI